MRFSKRGVRLHGAHRSRHQDLWPSSAQVRRFVSLGSSVLMTLKTSDSFFMSFDLDWMTNTDWTDWWSHFR
jgi:hypothetical protein